MFFNYSENFEKDTFGLLSKRTESNETHKQLASEIGLDFSQLAIPHQVHSNVVRWIDKPVIYPNTDGLITQNAEVVLTLQVADCAPLFLYDKKLKIRALVHAGWKGIVSGIVSIAVKLMINNGSRPQDLVAFSGPSIKECCYEVDRDVANQFSAKSRVQIVDKFKVNLTMEIKLQLLQLKLLELNIHQSRLCTYENEMCHSYRRDGEKSGRMLAFFGVNK